MALSKPVEFVRRLGDASLVGNIVLAEQAVDTYGAGDAQPDARVIALDILLHRDLPRRAA